MGSRVHQVHVCVVTGAASDGERVAVRAEGERLVGPLNVAEERELVSCREQRPGPAQGSRVQKRDRPAVCPVGQELPARADRLVADFPSRAARDADRGRGAQEDVEQRASGRGRVGEAHALASQEE
jgi:hypothetical protein